MKHLLLAVAILPLAAAAAQPQAAAQKPSNEDQNIRAYIELLRGDVKKSKVSVMAEVMQLDADQAAKFWPLYKEFEGQLTKIGDEILGLVKNYAANYDNLTPAVADQLATKLLEIEAKRLDLKKTYYGRMKTALDPITAARFLQVENQLEKLLDLQLASQLPVVQ